MTPNEQSNLRVFQCDDETWYAAISADHASELYAADTGEACDDGYPHELTNAELDHEYPDFDEDGKPTGGTVTPREWLATASPGFLAGTNW